MRAEIFIANNRISEVDGEKERYYSRLLDVEARLDRLETSSFTALTQNGSPPVGAIENNDHVVKKEEEEEEEGSATLSVQTLKVRVLMTNKNLPLYIFRHRMFRRTITIFLTDKMKLIGESFMNHVLGIMKRSPKSWYN